MMINELSFRWGVHQFFLLTLIFDRMGRLGQIGSMQTPCKIVTSGHWRYKIGRWNLLKYQLSKQNKQNHVFGGHFPTGHNGVTDYCSYMAGEENCECQVWKPLWVAWRNINGFQSNQKKIKIFANQLHLSNGHSK